MTSAITWAAVGIFVFFIVIGLAMGLWRGIKRSALHFMFVIIAFVLAFFITPPIANLILATKLPLDGGSYTIGEYIIKMLKFDMTNFPAAESFVSKLPAAIVSPILFIVLLLVCYLLFDIIYHIVARISFGKKRDDFADNKAYRTYGGAIGIVEGFLFMVLLFAPLTSITNTFETISRDQVTVVTVQVAQVDETAQEGKGDHLQTIPEIINDNLPKEVIEAIKAYNNSVVGKIAGVGGFDDLLFDNMSKIEVDGQKIEIRKDILTGTKIYNDVAEFYNDLTDKNYSHLNFGALKTNISRLLDSGIFKGVVANTAEQLIMHYDEIEFLNDMPEIVTKLLGNVRTALQTKEIDFTEYLKNDLLKIADAGSKVFDSGVVDDYMALENKDFQSILKFIDEKLTTRFVEEVVNDLLETNIAEDCMPTLLEFAADKAANIIDGLEIKLNTDVTDIKGLIKTTKEIIPNVIDLCEDLRLPELLEAKDKIKFFTEEIDDVALERALGIAGTTLDQVRNLEILKNGDEYVLDQILAHYNFGLIGTTQDQGGNRVYDVVYEMVEGEEEGVRKAQAVTLDSYTKLFNHIQKPIVTAKVNGLLSDFDTAALSGILGALRENPNLIAEVVMPFKGVKALDLEDKVYNQVVTTLQGLELSEGAKLFDFTYLEKQAGETDAKNFERWNEAFETLGTILNNLNAKDKVTVEDKKYSYIEYLLEKDFDKDVLIDALLNDENFAGIVSPVFAFELLKPMSEVFVETIDAEIQKVTGLTSGTTYEDLAKDTNAASTMKQLLDAVKGLGGEDLDLQAVGNILDSLKDNAKAHGVFEKTFFNFIWYLTGDNLCEFKVGEKHPIDHHETIKSYLINDASATKELYLNISFADKFAEIEKAKDFGEKLAQNLQDIQSVTAENAQQFAQALTNAVEGFEDKDVVNALQNLEGFVDKESLKNKIGEDPTITAAVEGAIESVFSDKQDVANAFLSFLGLGQE